jgi:hypothetical protein
VQKLGRDWGHPAAPFLFCRNSLLKLLVEILSKFSDQNPQTLTNRRRWPRRVSAIRSPPLQAELP